MPDLPERESALDPDSGPEFSSEMYAVSLGDRRWAQWHLSDSAPPSFGYGCSNVLRAVDEDRCLAVRDDYPFDRELGYPVE